MWKLLKTFISRTMDSTGYLAVFSHLHILTGVRKLIITYTFNNQVNGLLNWIVLGMFLLTF